MSQNPWRHERSAAIADDIDFEIKGQELQFLEIELDPGESAVAEAGALVWKDATVGMTTVFGDGAGGVGDGFMGKLLGAGKRLIFLDETGVTTNMVRRYGWGQRGQRVKGYAPAGHWKITTFLAGSPAFHDDEFAPPAGRWPMKASTRLPAMPCWQMLTASPSSMEMNPAGPTMLCCFRRCAVSSGLSSAKP